MIARALAALVLSFTLVVGFASVGGASTAGSTEPTPAADVGRPPVTLGDGNGITVDASRWIDPRLLDVTVSTAALAKPAGVRILLPTGYQDHPGLHYPVLYLLHGGYGSYVDWTTAGHAEQLTAGLPLIVVMPDGGKGGWYSNWSNGGSGGPPQWETFHIDQLIPWVDANLRTVADRRGRAIAGLSMGGFGALSYAARHPERFAAVASFSGAVDSNNPALRDLIYLSPLVDGGAPGAIYGSAPLDGVLAEAHNPWNLAANLRRMRIDLYSGNGFPGSLDPPGATGYDYQEFEVREMNVALDQRLDHLGIAHSYHYYGNGTHSWPYWNRDLQQELPALMATLSVPGDHPGPRPRPRGHGPRSHGSFSHGPERAASPPLPGAGPAAVTPDRAGRGRAADRPGPSGAGSTLYVDTRGADNPSCSRRSPCGSISHAASVAAPGDTISVGRGTFKGDVTLDASLTVEGSPGGTTVVGDAASGSATITVAAGADVTLDDLTIANASPVGDGVDNYGTLLVKASTISRNGGAGLYVRAGSASVDHSVISGNGTYGLANDAVTTVEESVISDNDYGVANDGTANLAGTTISRNGSAGAFNLGGSLTLRADRISGNVTEGVQGFSGATVITDATITRNGTYGVTSSPSPLTPAPTVTVTDSTVSRNGAKGLLAVDPITVTGRAADSPWRGPPAPLA